MRLLLTEIVCIDKSGKDMVLAVGVRLMPNSTPPALSNRSQSTTSLRITAPRSRSGTKDLLEPPHMSSEKDVVLDGPAPSRKRGSSHLDEEPARQSPRLVGLELEHRAPGTSTPGERTPHEQLVDEAHQIKWENPKCLLRAPDGGGGAGGEEIDVDQSLAPVASMPATAA
ncbi:hypothetical protein FRC08_011390 [Ceratobasidium sp. 394]|nr:hypothetical protein FRC08_011390 [Ceratobasidium sp. 394]